MANPIIALDLEMCGNDVEKHSVVQIGAAALDPTTLEEVGAFCIQVQCPHAHVEGHCQEIASKIHGLDTAAGVQPAEARRYLDGWLGGLAEAAGRRFYLLGHGISYYDRPFLERFMGKELYGSYFLYRIRDTRPVVMFLHDAGLISRRTAEGGLETIAKRIGAPLPTEGKAHNALYDARLTASVWRTLCRKFDLGVPSRQWIKMEV